jgi:hypothetical protein
MDWQFEVIISEALDCLTDLLKELKGVVIKPEGYLDTVLMCMKMLFYKMVQLTQELEFILMIYSNFLFCIFFQTPCQTMEQTVEGDDEETGTEDLDSEACMELLEHAGDVVLAFGNAMASQEFAPYFTGLLSAFFHRAMSLFYFYDFLSIYLSNYFVCRGSIVRLRKCLSVPASVVSL